MSTSADYVNPFGEPVEPAATPSTPGQGPTPPATRSHFAPVPPAEPAPSMFTTPAAPAPQPVPPTPAANSAAVAPHPVAPVIPLVSPANAVSPAPTPVASAPTPVATPPSTPEATQPTPVSPPAGPVADTTNSAAYALSQGWEYIDLDDPAIVLDQAALQLLEPRTARDFNAIPVRIVGRAAYVAVGDPDDVAISEALRPHLAGMTMRLIYAEPSAIRHRIDDVYSATSDAVEVAKQAANNAGAENVVGGDLGRIANTSEGGTQRLLDFTLEQALRDGASDVHIEATEHGYAVRQRVDGKLMKVQDLKQPAGASLVALIKVMARMRSDNMMVPDSGVLYQQVKGGKDVDVRVETTPSAWGSNAVLRLQQNIWRPLSQIGFSDYNEQRFRRALAQPFGLILMVGPTGSGKSTVNYASLNEKINPEVKIITLEDPIEYKAPAGLTQIQVNKDQGMTFGSGVRSILRQDPDIILIGEMRDTETAEAAIDAAMTGHLVFSTLHVEEAPLAMERLIRLGIDPFLVASSLRCVVSQRLVRRVCTRCLQSAPLDHDLWNRLVGDNPHHLVAPDSMVVANPRGCKDCHHTGYDGRVPLQEVMLVTRSLRHAIADGARQAEVDRLAVEGGMTSMRHDGIVKAMQGVTTFDQVVGDTLDEF